MKINFSRLVGLKELRIILDPKCKASKGAREYVQKFYSQLKKKNPNLAILVRECEGVKPRLWVRYAEGREISISLTNQDVSDIHKRLQAVGAVRS
ncbi:NADH dehydrogenase [ubiquinone] 1 alpha subcomplex subunit 2 [Drosophila grimshawi]|uniref:NADH dehydrogenase [ubiquinone] 1 alpha subcomplex subunit 2 n=1 Tax=Drosophila grimshawi TaxID=7222 RepID=B4JCL2_DROGR|nr:NADH dehydrogenase [ubiquinone] 1 alpha subcomplex subunit 2 [Drosophila grimshawi]EDW04176.1 GH10130 [Drosophila grimshawi]